MFVGTLALCGRGLYLVAGPGSGSDANSSRCVFSYFLCRVPFLTSMPFSHDDVDDVAKGARMAYVMNVAEPCTKPVFRVAREESVGHPPCASS